MMGTSTTGNSCDESADDAGYTPGNYPPQLDHPQLDRWTGRTLLHSGQNYEPELDSIFFDTMKIRRPDAYLGSRFETLFGQIAKILEAERLQKNLPS